jgi:cbb3-type cytochrome oxidase subunit 1
MIRAALVHLGIGFLLGGLMLFNKGVPFDAALWRLLPIHIELLLFGWTLQLAMGTAFWIAPRFSTPPRFGRVWLAAAAFALLNAGVLLSAAGQWNASATWQVVGRAALLLSGGSFIAHIIPRIKPLTFSEMTREVSS